MKNKKYYILVSNYHTFKLVIKKVPNLPYGWCFSEKPTVFKKYQEAYNLKRKVDKYIKNICEEENRYCVIIISINI